MIRISPAALAAAALLMVNVSAPSRAESLSGSPGKVRYKILFNKFRPGNCKPLHDRYVRAAGHSAFASTTIDYYYGSDYICAIALNARSQEAAEREALKDCNAGRKQYTSAQPIGRCEVFASK